MARPERFELPTTWFEASYLFPQFSAESCGLFYIEPPTDFGVMGR